MINFHPNCSLPLQAPAFISAPNVRSTLDIVWSCTSILILCSWSIQHLNVPAQYHPEGFLQKLALKTSFFLQKLKWMLATLIAPEALLAKALTDYRSAHLHSKMLQSFANEDGVPWSKTHTFFADMGGFAIRFSNEPVTWSNDPSLPPGHNLPVRAPSATASSSIQAMGVSENSAVNGRELDLERATGTYSDGMRTTAPDAAGRPSDASMEERRSQQSLNLEPSPLSIEVDSQTHGRVNLETHDSSQRPSSLEAQVQSTAGRTPSRDSINHVNERPNNQDEYEMISVDPDIRNSDNSLPPPTSQKHSQGHPEISGPQNWERLRGIFRYNVERCSRLYGPVAWQPHAANTAIGMEILSDLVIDRTSNPTSITLNGVSTILALEGDVWVVTAAQLYEARASGLIERLPYVAEDEISDKNKGDLLAKLLVLGQVSWLVIQLAARAIKHKPSSPLEVMTLSFAACAFIIYLLLLNHPQDVKTPIYIRASRPSTCSDMKNLAALCPTHFWSLANVRTDNSIPNNAYHHIWPLNRGRGPSTFWLLVGAGFGAAVFGGLHLIAWNIQFPTKIEHTLWQVSSLITMLVPIGTSLFFWARNVLSHVVGNRVFDFALLFVYSWFLVITMLAFVLARLFLVVEAFRSLYFLHPDVYVTTWAANMPHIG